MSLATQPGPSAPTLHQMTSTVRMEITLQHMSSLGLLRVVDYPAGYFTPGAYKADGGGLYGCIVGVITGQVGAGDHHSAPIHRVMEERFNQRFNKAQYLGLPAGVLAEMTAHAGPHWLYASGTERVFDEFMHTHYVNGGEAVKLLAQHVLNERLFNDGRRTLPAVSLSTLRDRAAIEELIHASQLEEAVC